MRIIAGTHRGRRLAGAPEGVRPTSDRVRESMFSILGRVDDARVLDVFAGTGALGIEALSRGARDLVAIDRAQGSLRTLHRNLEDLGLADRARIVRSDARRALTRLAGERCVFDLVFVDPPYDAELVAPVLSLLVEQALLAVGARVVVERAKRHDWPPVPGLCCDDERSYGDTVVQFLSACRDEASPVEA
jgi:16S rRNA (guanine966-N2)-methyltransferase